MLAKHSCKIEACVDGSKTKELGGGVGDGLILQKSVEIKTSLRGSTSPNFQHELGEISQANQELLW